MSSSFRCACSFEITTKSQIQVYAFAQTGGADLRVLNFRGEVFTGETQDCEHVTLALFQLLPAEFHGISAARDRGSQCTLAFTKIVIVSEGVFHIFECAQCVAYVTRSGGFLLRGAKILCGLEFTAEENWLSNPGGESPENGIERADGVEFARSQVRCRR